MLKKKMWRDIFQNKSQFITIFLMVLIGVMVYTGIEAYRMVWLKLVITSMNKITYKISMS